MKNKLSLLIILSVCLNLCFAGNTGKLPEIPWKAIVETQNGHPNPRWNNTVNIKLLGHYTPTDSTMVANSIATLDSLTECIHLKMGATHRGNIEIHFLDDTEEFNFKQLGYNLPQQSTWAYQHGIPPNNGIFIQWVRIGQIPAENRQNYLTNTLAFSLYPNFWQDDQYYEKQQQNEEVFESIFRSISSPDWDKLFLNKMLESDKLLLQAIYSHDFEKNFKIAKTQFKTIPWWIKVNPYPFLLLPTLLLLFLILAIYLSISKRRILNISNKFVQFNVNAIILGIFFATILSTYLAISHDINYDMVYSNHFLLTNISVGALAIFTIGLLTINLLRFFEIIIHKNTHRKRLRVALIFLTTGLLPFTAFLTLFLYSEYNNRLIDLSEKDIRFLSYIFIGCMIIATFRALISYFILKEKELIIENETKLSRLRELKSKAELNALHSRINPHFLYNALNSIAGLAHEDANKTEHMALSLSKLFRYSINKEQSDWTTLQEEIEMVKIYLDVERVRFEDRLSYSIELPQELGNNKIPRFIIQPLVENAVKHGISKSVESGRIKIVIKQEERRLFIAVYDDGPAFPDDLTPGFGIQSIYDKLEILYPEKFELKFINLPKKQVLIQLN